MTVENVLPEIYDWRDDPQWRTNPGVCDSCVSGCELCLNAHRHRHLQPALPACLRCGRQADTHFTNVHPHRAGDFCPGYLATMDESFEG